MHNHQHTTNTTQALSLAFWLNFIFSIIELIGGVLTNSTAIITDALHDFTDAMSIGLAVWLEKLSGKPANNTFSFGFKRFSLLSALGMSLFLLVGSITMIVSAIKALINPQQVHSFGMLGLAVLGIIVNGLAFVKIKNGGDSHAHSHSHSHGHHHSHHHHNDNLNQNSKAIMLHLLEDLLGWIAVLIGATVIYFTDWFWIDPILAIMIAIFVSYNAIKNIIATLKILLLAVPNGIDIAQLQQKIADIEGVTDITKLQVFSLDGMEHIAIIQIISNGESAVNTKLQTEIKQVCQEFNINDVTVQTNV